jgi:hypothetical protein
MFTNQRLFFLLLVIHCFLAVSISGLSAQNLSDSLPERLAVDSFVRYSDTVALNIVIQKIDIQGNKKTKTNIILRELTFKLGDTISLAALGDVLKFNRARLLGHNAFQLG